MRAHNGHFVIEIDEQRPADGGIVTQSLTSPCSFWADRST